MMLRKFALMAMTLCLAATAHATGTLSSTVVGEGTRYYRKASQGTDATVLSWPGGSGLSVLVYNEDATNALLVRFIRAGDGDEAVDTDEELTAPSDSTWSEVQSIPASGSFTFDARKARGIVLDRASGSGAVVIRLLD